MRARIGQHNDEGRIGSCLGIERKSYEIELRSLTAFPLSSRLVGKTAVTPGPLIPLIRAEFALTYSGSDRMLPSPVRRYAFPTLFHENTSSVPHTDQVLS